MNGDASRHAATISQELHDYGAWLSDGEILWHRDTMSYILRIWEKPADQPWPSTIDEATSLLKFLRDRQHPENPKFVTLVQRLTKRYPDITSPQAEEMPESELAWSEGPLDGKPGTAVYAVGLARPMVGEVCPFVVAQANALGLSVTDEQAGLIFLANGQVLAVRVHKEPPRTSPHDDVPEARDVERIVFERLTPMMERHGFKARKTDRTLRQEFAGGSHEVHVYAEDRYEHCDLVVTVNSLMDVVSDLIKDILFPDEPPEKRAIGTMLTMHRWLDEACDLVVRDPRPGLDRRFYRLTSHQQIDAAVEHLLKNVETRLFPILEKYKTLEGMDALLNTEPIEAAPLFVILSWGSRHIVTAYLAGNPRLDAICDEFLSRVTAPDARPDIVRCVEYVRRQQAKPGGGPLA